MQRPVLDAAWEERGKSSIRRTFSDIGHWRFNKPLLLETEKKFSLFLSCTYVLTCAYKSPTTSKLQTHSRLFFSKKLNIFDNNDKIGKYKRTSEIRQQWNMEDLHDVKFPINIYYITMYDNRTYSCTSSWKSLSLYVKFRLSNSINFGLIILAK